MADYRPVQKRGGYQPNADGPPPTQPPGRSIDADRLNEIREGLTPDEDGWVSLPTAEEVADLLAALDAAEQRAKLLEQRIERQRIELAGANDRNRRGNEFARRQAEQERDEAKKRAAIWQAGLRGCQENAAGLALERNEWKERANAFLHGARAAEARAEAAEKEREKAREARDNWKQSDYNNRVRAEAAEARLAETLEALEQIAAMDEPDMYAGTAERFRSLARAALTTHPADE